MVLLLEPISQISLFGRCDLVMKFLKFILVELVLFSLLFVSCNIIGSALSIKIFRIIIGVYTGMTIGNWISDLIWKEY